MSVTSWFLVSSSGTRHRLPKELIFVGREDCELMLQSRSVDKQHAVINYNPATDQHLVKDLGSLNGTFVNDLRIPEQSYIALKLSDVVRFGYDPHVYVLEKSQHRVPEEALKHEKYTSQLQMGVKVTDEKRERTEVEDKSRLDKMERNKTQNQEAPMPGPTPLYGQPSWWGEEEVGRRDCPPPELQKDALDAEVNGSLSVFPFNREPSYFEIPTKDFQPPPRGAELHEIPTKDTDVAPPVARAPPSPPTPTPPVVQSHASFTIEFDDHTPGKIKIKDHVTKFSSRQRKAPAAAAAELMAAQSKVADWLVQSDVTMMRRRPTCEDVYSTKSDLAVNIKTLKGHHHEDGTQSDSEDPVLKGRSKSHQSVQSEQSELSQQTVQSGRSDRTVQSGRSDRTVQSGRSDRTVQSGRSDRTVQSGRSDQTVQSGRSHHAVQSGQPIGSQYSGPAPASPVAPERPLSRSPPPCEPPPGQQAFIIEFFDDNPRKKRSQSFTHSPAHADSYSTLKAKLERRKGGERPASMHAHIPPTQQVTVPLKSQGPGGHGPQRSGSLKREKTEGEAASCRSSPGAVIRPFGSVGKKSQLVQDFTAEFLKGAPPPTGDQTSPPPMSAPPVMVTVDIPSPQHSLPAPSSVSRPASPLRPVSHPPLTAPAPSRRILAAQLRTASPIRASGPPMSPAVPLGVRTVDPRASQRSGRNEEDDSLSDAGTYTIETESQDQEVEEARNMIDQVFGVLDSPEYSGVNAGVYRPVIHDGKDEQTSLASDASLVDPVHGFNPGAVSGTTTGPVQVPSAAALEGPKWVSRWASLADGYAEAGSTPPQVEALEDLHLMSRSLASHSYDSESESSHSSRTKRLLPQVPKGDKLDGSTPSILIRHDPHPDQEALNRASSLSRPQESTQLLGVQDDVDPDSLSDASRSDDGLVRERAKENRAWVGAYAAVSSPGDVGPPVGGHDKVSPSAKSTSFYIGSEDGPGKQDQARSPGLPERGREPPAKTPPTTVLIRHLSGHEPRRTGVKPNSSAPNLQTQDKDSVPTRDGGGALVRQESFTKERPSEAAQMKKLPHISSHPSIRDLEQRREVVQDMQPFLKDPEGTLSSLDSRFHSSGSGRSSKKGGSSSHVDDSLSGESDVDTASTVSQVSNKNTALTSATKKRPAISSLQKEKSSSSPSIQEKGRQLTARERLSEKRRGQAGGDAPGKAEATKRFQMRRSGGNRGSLDLSEGSGQHWTETVSSDHEAVPRTSSRSKKPVAPLQKEDDGKTAKTAAQQVLMRSNSLSAPRPTRASMLRRARLGEASDNEGTETDRGSQNSDIAAAPSKASSEGKKLSRLDILAMPRKRTGSFTAPSDSEAPSAGRSALSGRTAESVVPTRKTSVGDARQAASRGSGTPAKQPLSRTRPSGAKYPGAGARRRQKGADYSSSSDEEYETSPGSSKTKRPAHPAASTQHARGQRTAASRSKSVSVETEEDEVQNEVDPYQNWTTHSAEIAKLSHDLAKDLAILAREIHDVAGDGDPPAGGAATSPASTPTTPASTISAREELVQHIPEASLNYQKVPPGRTAVLDLDANMNEAEPGSTQRRPWNRQEVILDNLMLNPVSQLSQAIRENTEQLAEKMKVLFHNKVEVWEEIEAKINAENEVPLLKTSNKEITSILKELRRVQRQLEVINTIVEPSGIRAGVLASPSLSQTRASPRERKPPGRTPGPRGGPLAANANESAKRPGARGTDGGHHVA